MENYLPDIPDELKAEKMKHEIPSFVKLQAENLYNQVLSTLEKKEFPIEIETTLEVKTDTHSYKENIDPRAISLVTEKLEKAGYRVQKNYSQKAHRYSTGSIMGVSSDAGRKWLHITCP
jgi:hypothetical protein